MSEEVSSERGQEKNHLDREQDDRESCERLLNTRGRVRVAARGLVWRVAVQDGVQYIAKRITSMWIRTKTKCFGGTLKSLDEMHLAPHSRHADKTLGIKLG